MDSDEVIRLLEGHNLIGVTEAGKNKFTGYLNGSSVTVTIRKNPRLGYAVEVKGAGDKYSLGNHDHDLSVAMDIVHWSQFA